MIGARDILQTLNASGVRYVVVGGLAQTFQGLNIKTDDLDVCPADDADNLERLASALTDMGAREWDPHKGEAVERQWTAQMLEVDHLWILHTRYGPLDLLFKPAGTRGYQSLSQDALVKAVGAIEVPVASIDALIEMKESAGRPKDREHLSLLYRLRRILNAESQQDERFEP